LRRKTNAFFWVLEVLRLLALPSAARGRRAGGRLRSRQRADHVAGANHEVAGAYFAIVRCVFVGPARHAAFTSMVEGLKLAQELLDRPAP
jgi:hypothetical protein